MRDDKVGIVFLVYVPKEQLHKTARRKLLRKHVRDAFARMPITIGVRCMAHGLVLGLIAEQSAELAVDDVLLGADELQRAGGHALGALGGVAHDEYRLAQARGLLLYAARVGEDEVARGHEVVEVEHLERVDDVQAVEAVELLVGGLADEWVHVDGVDSLGVGVLLHHAADGAEHAVHGLAKVLAAVSRDEDEAGALGPLELGLGVSLAHGGAQSVDAGISGDPDLRLRLALAEQVLLARLRGCEVVLAHDIDRLAVELFGPRAVDVVRAQACLHVAYGDLQVEARERRGEAGRRVAVHEHDVGLSSSRTALSLSSTSHVTSNSVWPGLMIARSWSGATSKTRSTWSSISRCWPVTVTTVSNSSLRAFSSLTSGHILIASGRVPKTSMIFFIIGPFSCAEPYGHESYKKQRTIASLQKEELKTKLSLGRPRISQSPMPRP